MVRWSTIAEWEFLPLTKKVQCWTLDPSGGGTYPLFVTVSEWLACFLSLSKDVWVGLSLVECACPPCVTVGSVLFLSLSKDMHVQVNRSSPQGMNVSERLSVSVDAD